MATLKSIAADKGWEFEKNYMYGNVDGYLITTRQVIDYMNGRNNGKFVFIPLLGITEEQARTLANYLKENKKDLKVSEFGFENPSVLVLRLAEVFKGYTTEQFDHLMNELISFFKLNNIGTQSVCPHCGHGEVDATMKINKIAFHAHQACITKAQKAVEESKQQFNSQNKNYGLGMLGAFIGAIIGAIPWIALEIFWGYAAILSLLIGYGAYYGYKYFGGVVTSITKWLLIIPMVFAVLFSTVVSVIIKFSMEDIPLIIENIEYNSSVILENLGIGVVFVALGFFSMFKTFKSDEIDTKIE